MTPRQRTLLSKLLSPEEFAAFTAEQRTVQEASAKISELLAKQPAEPRETEPAEPRKTEPAEPRTTEPTRAREATEPKTRSLPNTVPTVEPGYYVHNGTIYRVRRSHSGKTYAEAWVEHGDGSATWEYQKGIVFQLSGRPVDWTQALRLEREARESQALKSQVIELRERLTALQADLEALVAN